MEVAGRHPGERVLWRGSPDPGRAVRRAVLSKLTSTGFSILVVGTMLVGSGIPSRLAGDAVGLLPLIGLPVAAFVAWLIVSLWRVRRRALATRYTLTERRVVVDGPRGVVDLRLANLPELRAERDQNGVGSILFTWPSGAGPERYLRRVSRFIGAGEPGAELITDVPDVERVLTLMRTAATAEADAVTAPGSEATDPARRLWSTPPGPRVEADVQRVSFTAAAATVPVWFSGVFLVSGLAMVALAFIVGLGGGGLGVAGLGAVFAVLGGALVRGRLRQVRLQARLHAHGMPVVGRVTRLAATGVKTGNEYGSPAGEQWVVAWAYELLGRHYEGRSRPVPWPVAARYAAGDSIPLLVDAEDPSRSGAPDLDA